MNTKRSHPDHTHVWNPVSFDFLLSNYTFTNPRCYGPFLIWFLLIAICWMLSASLLYHDWLPLAVERHEIINFVIFNPVMVVSTLLLLWFGFEWGFIPVYLSAFAVAYISGVPVTGSLLVGISFVLGMGFIALSYHSIKVPYNLGSFKSITTFVVVIFLGALASSMGSFIWGFTHQLSAQDTLMIWKSWWTGLFFQSIFVTGPLLYLFSSPVERVKSRLFDLPSIQDVSIRWIYGAVISIAATLALFIFSGYQLGRLNVREVIGAEALVPARDILGSLEAFEIITWTSIGLIIVSGYTAIYLLNTWNRTLTDKVNSRTKELVENREKLKDSLREKEILFKEIKHRVKNNLAQVHGMLELQETMSENREVTDLLKISRSRVRTMALAHEALYDTENFTRISLKVYLGDIARITHRSFHHPEKKIELNCGLEDLHIHMAKAIPLGLMVSEILINAHKHAFQHTTAGRIDLETKIKDGHLALSIADNGSGIPEDVRPQMGTSLGMTLIQNFTQQMDAILDIDSDNTGTRFLIKIPLERIKGK